MNSEIKPCYDEKRILLADNIPLTTPLSLIIAPSLACNFRCNYCPHSLSDEKWLLENKNKNMKWVTFTTLVNQISDFQEKIKVIHLQGMGEPLINRRLPDMIKYLKERKVTERVNVVTNGSLLNHELSLKLIKAGVSAIKISLQGLNSDKYLKICGARINFDNLVENIKYLFSIREKCQIFVKIADIALEKGEANQFYDIFRNISDRMYIEKICPMFKDINYEIDRIKNVNLQTGMYFQEHPKYEICSLAFYMMYITSSGDVFPCCNYIDPAGYGNIETITLKEIWFGKNRTHFLKMMIKKERRFQNEYPLCQKCTIPDACMRPEDYLDPYSENLLKVLPHPDSHS